MAKGKGKEPYAKKIARRPRCSSAQEHRHLPAETQSVLSACVQKSAHASFLMN